MMRLGGPVFGQVNDSTEWIMELQKNGYSAAYCPENITSKEIVEYRQAAAKANIIIAEVGAWSNPISPDDIIRKMAIQYCQEKLALAEEIGAVCCVNISGSRGDVWYGPHADNFSDETFQLIVDTVREIIDAVKPSTTFYTLETMPWAFPYNTQTYLDLIKAIDRPAFAVHLDPVNLITSPQEYYDNANRMKECFSKLGPYIKSCHAKDVSLSNENLVHMSEVRPGLGNLDYRMLLKQINLLGRDTPLMIEHLVTEEEYKLAASFIRSL